MVDGRLLREGALIYDLAIGSIFLDDKICCGC